MVKRLHLGRASEAGVLAASLAAGGFNGPRTVLEGKFGFLRVFCTEFDESLLTKGLGEEFVVLSTVLKRYPLHATAHAPVKAVRELAAAHGFGGADVDAVTVGGTARMLERHNIAEPADLMLAQYSIPFCVALALHREARDPESFDEGALADPNIRALCRRVTMVPEEGGRATVAVALKDGRRFEAAAEGGMLEPGELDDKFTRLTRGTIGEAAGTALLGRLRRLEDEADVSWLGA
jgi:2-methylcitrate dehydratase PrpD